MGRYLSTLAPPLDPLVHFNISSVVGKLALPTTTVYSATKAAVDSDRKSTRLNSSHT